MNPLRYYVFPRSEVERLISLSPIPADYLRDYLAVRPDVLDDDHQDIFAPNSRTSRQQWTAYELFERVTSPDDADFIVCQTWLEIFEASGVRKNSWLLLNHLIRTFPEKLIVTSWNHDTDAAIVSELQNLPANMMVLNYNTSKPTKNDVLLPFWNVETRIPADSERTLYGSFIGHIGGIQVRKNLQLAFSGRGGWLVSENRMQESDYLAVLRRSRFALCPRGGGLSSYRLYEAIQCGAIPIIYADAAVLPYPDMNWGLFSVRIPEACAGNFDFLMGALHRCPEEAMRHEVQQVRKLMSLLGAQQEVQSAILRRLK